MKRTFCFAKLLKKSLRNKGKALTLQSRKAPDTRLPLPSAYQREVNHHFPPDKGCS